MPFTKSGGFPGLNPPRQRRSPIHRPSDWQPRWTARNYSAVKGLYHRLLIKRQPRKAALPCQLRLTYFGVTSIGAYVSGTAASGDSTRNVKLCCKYSSTEVLV